MKFRSAPLPAVLCTAFFAAWETAAQVLPPAEPTAAPSTAPAGKTPAPPASPAPFIPPASEEEFLKSALKSGASEVRLAQLALRKTEEPKVKDFAQLVVSEHTAANDTLKTAAEGTGIAVDSTDPKSRQKHADLSLKAGKEFDEAFLEEMAASHAGDIALYEAGKKVAKSRTVVAFIEKTLPVVQRRAEKINLMGPGSHRPDAGSPAAKPPATPPGTKPVA